MREIDGDPAFVASWNEAIKNQRLEKAVESQSIDLVSLASTPMHDRLTFERAQAVEEKMDERLRKGGNVYHDWMAEIDRQVAHHEQRGEKKSSSSTTVPKKRGRPSSLARCV
jgi:thiamine pyrophosphate-dependent acetolactate synthase large subunit-like protein